jgi:hypothetical protein
MLDGGLGIETLRAVRDSGSWCPCRHGQVGVFLVSRELAGTPPVSVRAFAAVDRRD